MANNHRLGVFEGKVLESLKYLKMSVNEQKQELKQFSDKLDSHLHKTSKGRAVTKYMLGVIIAWLSAITMYTLDMFMKN